MKVTHRIDASVFARATARSLTAALSLAALCFWAAGPVSAQSAAATTDADRAAQDHKKSDDLQEIVVTGSLIPQLRVQTSNPVSVITADDIQTRGFATVADALQHASFSTGSVQGPQYNGGFTPGAQTLSLFGLSPSYVKYLIDGRPIADYPALYNGTDIIASISGIPTILVDHIDILPGGQSSLYGSDAIAGVVNIIMRKKVEGPEVDARYGWTKDGGGTDKRLGLADSFTFGSVNILVGGQYDKTDPIWGYQRPLTKSYYAAGTSPQTAERDFMVFGLYGPTGDGTNAYYFKDPANCANVAGQFNNSIRKYSRPDRGDYCGTTNAGYYTIGNGEESTQAYVHATDDITDHIQLFTDILINHDVVRYNTGTSFFGTADDSTSPYYYYEDPSISGDLLNVQRIFSPEEAGGLNGIDSKNTNNSIRATVGLQGSLGSSSWTYDADMTYTENKLTEKTHLAFTSAINDFFAPIFGPAIGFDPNQGVNIFSPDYAAFYRPITPAQYASFTGYTTSYSRTEESLARAQLTNPSLFALPGGEAGMAVVVEGGSQGWDYTPDPRYLDGETYLYTATAGSGHRSRYAATTEFRLPVHKMLTLSASGRYDDYRVAGENVDKATYNLGLEFRPVSSFLIRGRYGTAFKAPTLSDEYQGVSGNYQVLTDYYQCAKEGFSGTNLGKCPQSQQYYFGTTSGDTHLKPITAKVSDIGGAWTPLEHLSFTVDYLHWKISDEVLAQNADTLLKTESLCRLGTYDVTSPTCVAAISQVARDGNGVLVSVYTPKVNVSQEVVDALSLGFNYTLVTDRIGNFIVEGSYTDLLKHTLVQYAGDPVDNLFNDPVYSQDFKTKENLSVTWSIRNFGATLYVEHYGATPNYLATVNGYGTDGAGRLGSWTIANLSARYQVLSSLQVSINVDNVFDRMPPADHSYPGTELQPYNELNYNIYGRSFFVQANYKFGK